MASRQLTALLEGMRAQGGYDLDLMSMRKMMSRLPAYPRPDDMTWEEVDAGSTPAIWVTPENGEADRAIIYLHGGGYATGSARDYLAIACHLARAARGRVLAVDYRLAPEHPFPAALDDALAAYAFLRESGYAPDRIALAGDSSGGGLVVATLIALRDRGEPLPRTGVCLCPWTDLTLSGPSLVSNAERDPMIRASTLTRMAEAYLGDRDRRTPTASPLFADLAGLPPLLVQVGSSELLHDDAVRLAEQADAAGVDVTLQVWEDAFHVWHSFADHLPEAQEAMARIGAHLDHHFSQDSIDRTPAHEH
jgi:epsilon-lactone hydrolase